MATKVYGHSDDLIEFEGDLSGEIGCYGTDDDEDMGVLLAFSDGTILSVKYGKNGMGIWGMVCLHAGRLFAGIDQCTSEDDDPYSDVATFKDGKLKAWAGSSCQPVK